MSERRRRYSLYDIDRPGPIIEDRLPERNRSPSRSRRRTIIFESTPVHHRRKERVVRPPSPVRYVRLPRAPTPPPILYAIPPRKVMPPKQTPASKPIVPLAKALLVKKEDIKPTDDKNKNGPRVKVYERGHRQTNSFDTGYASGLSSPWDVEERSPLDYTTAGPRSPRPRPDTEPYEIITGTGRPKYVKTGGERKRDSLPPVERKKEVRYVIRTPDSPGQEDEYVETPVADVRKDRLTAVKKTTIVLQKELAKDEPKITRPSAMKQPEDPLVAQFQKLQADLERKELERQAAEDRVAEAERRLQQRELNELERRKQAIKERQAEDELERAAAKARREAELEKKQWQEIQATPRPRRPSIKIEQGPPTRRDTLTTTRGPGVLTTTTTQSPSVLTTGNPFLDPILEAQRDEDARQAREERRRGTEVKETGRTARHRPRKDDRYT